jgi:hypothetical protein
LGLHYKQPCRLTFLVDRSLGRTLPERMREVGVDAIGLDERYPQNALDEEWLPDAELYVGSKLGVRRPGTVVPRQGRGDCGREG